MTSDELRAEILRLYHSEAWPIGTIARTLGVHHDVVSRVLKREGLPPIRAVRPTIIEPFMPFIRETLEQYPRLQAQRLYDMCIDRGYPGAPTTSGTSCGACGPSRSVSPSAVLRRCPRRRPRSTGATSVGSRLAGRAGSSWPS